MVLHYFAWYCINLHYLAPSCTILHHLAPSCTILHHAAPSCTMLHHVAPCCTMLHHLAPSCTILHHPAPYFIILHRLAPSCTLLHYLALSCTILQWCPIVPIWYTCRQQMSPVIAFDIAVVAQKVKVQYWGPVCIWKSGWCCCCWVTSRSGWLLELLTELINKPQVQWCLCQGKLARLQSRSLHRGATFPERSIILVLAKFSPWKMEDKKLTINFCHRRNRDNKQDPAELGENQNETAFEVWTSVFVCSICIPDRTHGPSSGPPKTRSSGVGCCGAKSSGGNIHLKWKVWPVKKYVRDTQALVHTSC